MQTKSNTISPLFPNSDRNKRQAIKPSPLRRREELLRQISDQATLPPQRRLRWICRAMARELGASTRRLKRRGFTGIEPMRIKDQATQ